MMTNLPLNLPERKMDRILDKWAKRRATGRTKLKQPPGQLHDAHETKVIHQTLAELLNQLVPGKGIFMIPVNQPRPPSKEEGILLNPKLEQAEDQTVLRASVVLPAMQQLAPSTQTIGPTST